MQILLIILIICAAAAVLFLLRRFFARRMKNDGIINLGIVCYDICRGIFFFPKDAVQRKFGYCRMYDELAPAANMIIDGEPIRFSCGGRKWLLEFWKGQYGMTAGGEIGIYSADGNTPGDIADIMYDNTDLEIEMSLRVCFGGETLFEKCEKTWWLTGFVPGKFCWPKELTSCITLCFPDAAMLYAFDAALKEAGYVPVCRNDDYCYTIEFTIPHANQSALRTPSFEEQVQEENKFYCELYNDIIGDIKGRREVRLLKRDFRPVFKFLMSTMRPKRLFKTAKKTLRSK